VDRNLRTLVTGGSGFIGRNLAEYLCSTCEVIAPSSAELNLLDGSAVRSYLCNHRFDVVVHAATTRSNRRVSAPADTLDRNCRMFFNLARNAALFGKMISFGSGAEYDRRNLPPCVKEDYFDTSVPGDAYGFSKYICAKHIERSENILNLRLFGVFGKYEDYAVRFISNACCRVLKGLPIVIRQDVIFDYLYIDDLAKITSWFIEHQPCYKAYNVARSKGVALTELARIVAEVSGQHPQVLVRQAGLAPEYTADSGLMLKEIGNYRFREFSDSIRELYSWYASNQERIDADSLRFDD
jgi:UDP-glucose 4-epimerase